MLWRPRSRNIRPADGWTLFRTSAAKPSPDAHDRDCRCRPAESHEQESAPTESIRRRAAEVHAAVDAPASERSFPGLAPVHRGAHLSITRRLREPAPAESWFAPTPSVFDIGSRSRFPSLSSRAFRARSRPRTGAATPNPAIGHARSGAWSSRPRCTSRPSLCSLRATNRTDLPNTGRASRTIPPLHSFFAPASGDPRVEEPHRAGAFSRARGERRCRHLILGSQERCERRASRPARRRIAKRWPGFHS